MSAAKRRGKKKTNKQTRLIFDYFTTPFFPFRIFCFPDDDVVLLILNTRFELIICLSFVNPNNNKDSADYCIYPPTKGMLWKNERREKKRT